jgi:hypothetical protein
LIIRRTDLLGTNILSVGFLHSGHTSFLANHLVVLVVLVVVVEVSGEWWCTSQHKPHLKANTRLSNSHVEASLRSAVCRNEQ